MQGTTACRRAAKPRRLGPRSRAGAKRRLIAREAQTFAEQYERRMSELLDTLTDEELDGSRGPRMFVRLDSEGLPEAALIFDPETGSRQKVRFPIAGGEAA